MTQYFQSGRGRVGGTARTTFTPPESPFVDVAARDAWAAANLNNLFNSDSQFTLIEVTGLGAEQWSGDDTPSSYDNSGWVTISGGALTASEVKVLYESNPDTNALEDDKDLVLGNFSISGNRVISEMSLEVPPNTVYIGNGTALGSAIRSLHIRSDITGNTALLIAQLYDETNGFERAFVYEGGAKENLDINNPLGTDVSGTAQFEITTTADELITALQIRTATISQTVEFSLVIRTGSFSGAIAVEFTGGVSLDASGIGRLDLSASETPILVDSGTVLYVNLTCQGIQGVQVDVDTFVPNAIVERILVTRREIALTNDLSSVATSGDYNDLTNRPDIPTPIPARTDEDIRDVTAAQLIAGMNVTIVEDDVANTLTISSTGGSGGGTPPPASADIIYYGLSDSNNPSTVDVGTLTTEQDPTNPDTIATGTATQGQYFILLVPMDDDVTSIFDTVLNQDVTSIFTETDNVRNILISAVSVAFKSYVIGPLNAGLSETYVINFGS